MSYIGQCVRKEKVVTPIVAYRGWEFDESSVASFNHDPWQPGEPKRAECQFLSAKHPRTECGAEGINPESTL
jgi:hypothetical protein